MYKIIILDDHPIVLEAVKSIVDSSKKIKFLKGFTNKNDLVNYLKTNYRIIDCLLLDLDVKTNETDGIDICKFISDNYPNIKVIIFSSFNQKSLVLKALKNGASGYMIKNSSLDEIILGIDTVSQGKLYLHESLGDVFFNKTNSFRSDYIPKLTRREKEILKLILDENTTIEIANKLFISISTVETHRANLFLKTGVKNMAGLIKIAIEKNLTE